VPKKRTGLGRGLAELLGESTATADAEVEVGTSGTLRASAPPGAEGLVAEAGGDLAGGGVWGPGGAGIVEIPVAAVRPNPRQPRRAMDLEGLKELADSIDAVGMVQPVIVRETADGFELIAGERRWRAAQMAGFTAVPAILRQASDTESLEIALVENVVRQELNPVDEAYALQVLLEDLGVTQEALAARVGMSRPAIANKVRLLELPPPVQELLASGSLTEGHGRALLGLRSRGSTLSLARKAAKNGMSVRAVEAEVRRRSQPASDAQRAGRPETLAPDLLAEVQDRVFGALGVIPKVRVRDGRGHVELPFAGEEDLHRLLDRLAPK
jgi:ParB family transcriptional regulator, chromosome partitioning protein